MTLDNRRWMRWRTSSYMPSCLYGFTATKMLPVYVCRRGEAYNTVVRLVVQVAMQSEMDWRVVRPTHVNSIQLVSDFQVGIDAVLVNVADDGHVGHSIRRFGTLRDEARPVEDGASSHRL